VKTLENVQKNIKSSRPRTLEAKNVAPVPLGGKKQRGEDSGVWTLRSESTKGGGKAPIEEKDKLEKKWIDTLTKMSPSVIGGRW